MREKNPKYKNTITCATRITEKEDVEFKTNPYKNKRVCTFKLTVLTIF